jgi:hypothetical protein
MPRAPAKIRKRYIEGSTEVCPWDVEETLLYGITPLFGPPCMFKTLDEWRREWSRWGDLILRKCIFGISGWALRRVGLPMTAQVWQDDASPG